MIINLKEISFLKVKRKKNNGSINTNKIYLMVRLAKNLILAKWTLKVSIKNFYLSIMRIKWISMRIDSLRNLNWILLIQKLLLRENTIIEESKLPILRVVTSLIHVIKLSIILIRQIFNKCHNNGIMSKRKIDFRLVEKAWVHS